MSALEPKIKERVELWLRPEFDEVTRGQIEELMSSDPKTITESFYKDLDFGTIFNQSIELFSTVFKKLGISKLDFGIILPCKFVASITINLFSGSGSCKKFIYI